MTRREWCTRLATLVSPSFPVEAAAALHAMLPAMAMLPEELFSERSLMQVAAVKRRQAVPAWDELVGALQEYRRTFLPTPPVRRLSAAPEPAREHPTTDEIAYVTQALTTFRREQAEDALARERSRPAGFDAKPLRDVSAKGANLLAMRRARGIDATKDAPMGIRTASTETVPA